MDPKLSMEQPVVGTSNLDKVFNSLNIANSYTHEERLSFSNKFEEKRGLFFQGNKIVLPESLYYYAIGYGHSLRGHDSIISLYNFLIDTYFFENKKDLKEKVTDFVKSCIACLVAKPQSIPFKQGSFATIIRPRQLFVFDVMEFQRIQNNSAHNYWGRFWLICTDAFSSFTWGFSLGSQTESEVVRAFLSLFTHGIPESILSDNATVFKHI